jgi:hypothetical protein
MPGATRSHILHRLDLRDATTRVMPGVLGRWPGCHTNRRSEALTSLSAARGALESIVVIRLMTMPLILTDDGYKSERTRASMRSAKEIP